MADSIRKQIIGAIAARVATITTAGGYGTDIGGHVFLGYQQVFEGDQLPGCMILPQPETAAREGYGKSTQVMPVQIVAVSRIGAANPVDLAESMLADLIKAIAGGDRTLGGLAQCLVYSQGGTDNHPEPTEQAVFVAAEFEITYQTTIGNPYSR
ncbi:MAG: hypothetical protein R6W92_17005 [Desulfocurvibacter africanus]